MLDIAHASLIRQLDNIMARKEHASVSSAREVQLCIYRFESVIHANLPFFLNWIEIGADCNIVLYEDSSVLMRIEERSINDK
jgi:uncharacterized membrane protein